jgi:hypothetical protein
MNNESLFQLVIAVCCLTSSLVVISVAKSRDQVKEEIRETVNRAGHCSPYYNDGTDRWAECMGVGPVPAPVGSASREGRTTDGGQ